MISIRRKLLMYLFGGMISATLLAGFATYVQVRHEMNEMFDYQLQQIATAFPTELSVSHTLQVGDDSEDEVMLQIWYKDNQLLFTSAPTIQLRRVNTIGFSKTRLNQQNWRVYSQLDQGRFIQVSQPTAIRNRMAASMALRSLIPFVVLIPLLGLLIWIVVGRALQPIGRLAASINQRTPETLESISDGVYPPELQPMLLALNGLLARLEQARTTQRAFVSDAAHELRTPLAALKLQLQLVERDNQDPELQPGLGKLHQRLNRASHLVQQLLTLARHEGRLPDRRYQKVNLQLLVAGVVSDLAPQAEHKHVDLGVIAAADGSDHAIYAYGDVENLRILLGNLVDNAVRYTPAYGRVDVSVSSADGYALLQVSDNGPGIPAADRERVFDRFYRREGSGVSGSGLGLFIARTIAAQHDATIELGNPDDGQGLLATLRIKQMVADPRSRSATRTAFPLREQHESPNIS
ncbi:two-component sensor histidine kinase [Herminiimonas sp. KBW02]|uniref:ATP-binding protein n=1 Tax=Herminiimonas sp. KBW02 TaxID=2153363 RepID=UPI000F59FD33|nr:ATP-binding protein [Herminiimonas sp. KBW02]RQO36353.1 two-component sensor histidine kinase [Herminiimonas sp. KBW02]